VHRAKFTTWNESKWIKKARLGHFKGRGRVANRNPKSEKRGSQPRAVGNTHFRGRKANQGTSRTRNERKNLRNKKKKKKKKQVAAALNTPYGRSGEPYAR